MDARDNTTIRMLPRFKVDKEFYDRLRAARPRFKLVDRFVIPPNEGRGFIVKKGQTFRAIEEGDADREDNVLRNAPHTIEMIGSDEWSHSYARSEAAWPLPWLRGRKFWPPVARVDNPHGDRNLVCSCSA